MHWNQPLNSSFQITFSNCISNCSTLRFGKGIWSMIYFRTRKEACATLFFIDRKIFVNFLKFFVKFLKNTSKFKIKISVHVYTLKYFFEVFKKYNYHATTFVILTISDTALFWTIFSPHSNLDFWKNFRIIMKYIFYKI